MLATTRIAWNYIHHTDTSPALWQRLARMHPYETLFIIQKLEEHLIAEGRLKELKEQEIIPLEDIKTVEQWVRGQCYMLEK